MTCQLNDALNKALEKFDNVQDEREAETILEEIRSIARKGFAPAQYSLGHLILMNPSLFDSDEEASREAAKWLKKAVANGIPEAFGYLGQMYADGDGVRKDIQKAIRLLTIAASAGQTFAQSRLGRIYWRGDEVPVDKTKAYLWYSQAVRQGEGEAQYVLGRMYFEGDPVPKDWDKALEYLVPAWGKGFPSARRMIEEIKAARQQ